MISKIFLIYKVLNSFGPCSLLNAHVCWHLSPPLPTHPPLLLWVSKSPLCTQVHLAYTGILQNITDHIFFQVAEHDHNMPLVAKVSSTLRPNWCRMNTLYLAGMLCKLQTHCMILKFNGNFDLDSSADRPPFISHLMSSSSKCPVLTHCWLVFLYFNCLLQIIADC